MTSTSSRYTPLIILALIAALVAMIWLYVGERSRKYVADEGSHSAAGEQQVFRWKLVTTWPKNFPGLGTAPEKFAKVVNTMSKGRLQIKVFGAGELVPAMGVFDAVSTVMLRYTLTRQLHLEARSSTRANSLDLIWEKELQ